MIDYCIIAAGGHAKRFLPYSLTLPKEMLPLNGIPAIEFAIEECIQAGIKRIIIITRPNNYVIYNHLKFSKYQMFLTDKFTNKASIEILVINEDENLPYGNAAPLLTVKSLLENKQFIVLFPDDIILGANPISELLTFANKNTLSENDIVISYQFVPYSDVHNYGNIDIGNDHEVVYIKQKPNTEITSNKVLVSRIILNDSIFNYINVAENGELDLGLAINSKLTNEPHSVFGCLITGEWICIDTPEKYLIAQNKYDNYLREVK